jgi:hypothetical protein
VLEGHILLGEGGEEVFGLVQEGVQPVELVWLWINSDCRHGVRKTGEHGFQ